MTESPAFSRIAGAIVEVAGISVVRFPEKHVSGLKRRTSVGITLSPALKIKRIACSVAENHCAIHQITRELDGCPLPGRRVCLVQRAHVQRPAFNGREKQPLGWTVCLVRTRNSGKHLAWFVEPTRWD